MKRAVLDPGVLVSARGGSFELIVPPLLLGELRLVLQRKMLRRYVDPESVGYPVLHSGRAPRGPRLKGRETVLTLLQRLSAVKPRHFPQAIGE